MWCLSHLCSCSKLNVVDNPPGPPRNLIVASESRFDVEFDQASCVESPPGNCGTVCFVGAYDNDGARKCVWMKELPLEG